jgi:hypothetical protein
VKTIYNSFGLKGNLVALGGNLWNEKVATAIRNKVGLDDLQAAARAFFDEILPEMQNFMEQKLAASDLQVGELKKVAERLGRAPTWHLHAETCDRKALEDFMERYCLWYNGFTEKQVCDCGGAALPIPAHRAGCAAKKES